MKLLPVGEGYDRFAKDYRRTWGHLDSFDWAEARGLLWPLLDQLTAPKADSANNAIAEAEVKSARTVQLLDAGCGDGRVLGRVERYLADRPGQLWGWDLSAAMLAQAAKRLGPTVRLQCLDLEEAPLATAVPESGFDLAWAFFVLVHLRRPQGFLEQLCASLRGGGRLVLNNIPQKSGYVVKQGGQEFQIDYFHHRDDEVAEALVAAGFSIDQTVATPFSTLWVARAAEDQSN